MGSRSHTIIHYPTNTFISMNIKNERDLQKLSNKGLKTDKKGVQLKLSSMSEHHPGIIKGRSSKNQSQLMQYIKKKARQNQKGKE